MTYEVDASRVEAEVANFPDHVLKSWRAFLGVIGVDPHARFGSYIDRLVPILQFPMRTWLFEIVQETSISGQPVCVFTGEFFPEYAPVYLVDETARTVIVLFLRENDRA